MPGRRASLVSLVVLAAVVPADVAVAAPPPAGALDGVTCVAGPSAAIPLGCQVVDATLKGIHEVVLGPGDAQLYVAAEQDEDLPYTASLTTYARDPATGALIAGGGERPGRTALAGG